MKKYLLVQFFLLASITLWSQTDAALFDFNQNRLKKQKTAMTILGSWAVGNMVAGAVFTGRSEGSDKYFHQMNIGWNAVNLTIAGFGLYSALTADPGSFNLVQTIEEQHRFQKILLFNAGLDVGYMLGGAYMMERSRRFTDVKADRLHGFGKSILLQGGFLFVFDLATFFALSADNPDLHQLIGSVTFSGNQISLCYRF
jgi:hypothetical protein